jgi:hypothetical protein
VNCAQRDGDESHVIAVIAMPTAVSIRWPVCTTPPTVRRHGAGLPCRRARVSGEVEDF